jgi:hypothetical protein
MNTACTQRSQCKSRYICIYIHTQEKLGELMGSIRKRMIFVERGRGRGGNSTRERFRIAGWPPKRGAWFWEVPWFCLRGQWAGIRACSTGHWCMGSCMPFLCVCCALERTGQLASISGIWGRKQEPHPPPPQSEGRQMSIFLLCLSMQEHNSSIY